MQNKSSLIPPLLVAALFVIAIFPLAYIAVKERQLSRRCLNTSRELSDIIVGYQKKNQELRDGLAVEQKIDDLTKTFIERRDENRRANGTLITDRSLPPREGQMQIRQEGSFFLVYRYVATPGWRIDELKLTLEEARTYVKESENVLMEWDNSIGAGGPYPGERVID